MNKIAWAQKPAEPRISLMALIKGNHLPLSIYPRPSALSAVKFLIP